MEIGEEDIFQAFRNAIVIALRDLLETKCLYQSIEVSLKSVENLVDRANKESLIRSSEPGSAGYPKRNFKQELEQSILRWKATFWEFQPEDSLPPQYAPESYKAEPIRLPLPSVKIPCSNCDAVLPARNSGYKQGFPILQADSFLAGKSKVQVFHLPFECQSCRKETVVFLVRRQDLKFTLCGRSQFQPVPVPKFIPEPIEKYYRNAKIAYRTGFVLAGILYLRVMIEQHMRNTVSVEGRYDLAELGEKYGKTLPEDFRSRFPSLKKACDDLSVAIHAADENHDLFIKTLADVEKHFDALRLFELVKGK